MNRILKVACALAMIVSLGALLSTTVVDAAERPHGGGGHGGHGGGHGGGRGGHFGGRGGYGGRYGGGYGGGYYGGGWGGGYYGGYCGPIQLTLGLCGAYGY